MTLLIKPSRHLLGKKSWNVYNAENIAKVKRDEAAAAAREADEEQRMQEVDAERRIQILRGLHVDAPPPPLPSISDEKSDAGRGARDGSGRDRKRRRIAGEDDTDRDIRLAQERSAPTPARQEIQVHKKRELDTPLTDSKGHINLFPAEGSRAARIPKNAEAEAEAATKKKEFEDQYTMRFSNAAGFKQAVGQTPWYQSTRSVESREEETTDVPSKDVWGNEDPRRKDRQKQRMAADDPLALIQKGVSGLRKVESERKKWKEEREQETRELIEAEKRRHKRRRKEDDLADFSLDHPTTSPESKDPHRRHHHHRSHRHHHRSQTQDPNPNQHSKKPQSESTKTGWQAGRGGRYSNQFAACLDVG